MNFAKVLRYFSKNSEFKNSTYIGKLLEVIAFPFKRPKVMTNPINNTMENLYDPPEIVNGTKVLDRNLFKKTITVSSLTVPKLFANDVLTLTKKYLLRIMNLKSVQENENGQQKILIDPIKINSWIDFDENIRKKLESLNVTEDNFSKSSVEMEYKNWSSVALLQAILPKNEPPLKSYSIIGHIIHLNIKDHLLDYRYIIGEILLDKVSNAKTVVYKKHIIDSVYRNFEMEVICGEPNFITSINANQCQFELDFSKVYYNPRLTTEHMRIIDGLKERDVLFDVFAGIGPFAIPAAKKKCLVFANDLNPESFKWLNRNIELNNKAKGNITTYNKDGKDFILKDVRENLLKVIQNDLFCGSVHVVMNLPATASTFMKYFKGLISKNDLIDVKDDQIKKCLPIIHCYLFLHDDNCGKTVFEQTSGMNLNNIEYSLQYVRSVSDSKTMFKMSFILPHDYLVADSANVEVGEPLPKRICTELSFSHLKCGWKKHLVRNSALWELGQRRTNPLNRFAAEHLSCGMLTFEIQSKGLLLMEFKQSLLDS